MAVRVLCPLPFRILKLEALRAECERQGLTVDLEVDGGINGDTAALAVKAGANVLVAGSYLFSDKMEENTAYLKSL